MITKSKQAWAVGETVKVGFVAGLLVVAIAGEAYVLSRNNTIYSFVPHCGLSKIDLDEAKEMIAAAKRQAERTVAQVVAKAAASARHAEALSAMLA